MISNSESMSDIESVKNRDTEVYTSEEILNNLNQANYSKKKSTMKSKFVPMNSNEGVFENALFASLETKMVTKESFNFINLQNLAKQETLILNELLTRPQVAIQKYTEFNDYKTENEIIEEAEISEGDSIKEIRNEPTHDSVFKNETSINNHKFNESK